MALGSGEGKGRKQGVQDLIKMLRDSRRKNLLIFDRAAKAFAGEAAACCMTEEPRYRADFKEDEVCRYWQMQQWPKKKKNPGEYWMAVQPSVKKWRQNHITL